MNYAEAIEWLKEHDVKKDDGTYYEFGEVSLSEALQKLKTKSLSCMLKVYKSLGEQCLDHDALVFTVSV